MARAIIDQLQRKRGCYGGHTLPSIFVAAVLLALISAGLAGCRRCGGEGAWLARIESLRGGVEIADSALAGGEAPAEAGQLLYVGARLETSADGYARLALRRGGALEVEPRSIVLFQEADAVPGGGETALLLEQGQIVGSGSEVEASALVITVGGRRIRIGQRAEARVTVPAGDDKSPSVYMLLGSATVESPDGVRREVVQGDVLEFGSVRSARNDAGVDAGVDAAVDATVLAAEDLVYQVELRRGQASLKNSGAARFKRLRRRRPLPVGLGSEIRLARRALVTVDPGAGAAVRELRGPAQLLVRAGSPDHEGRPTLDFESRSRQQTIVLRGRRGQKGPSYVIHGVRLSTVVTHRQIDVRIEQDDKRARVIVRNGAVELKGKNDQIVRVEAGQRATLSSGAIDGPKSTPEATLKVSKPGAVRVFVAGRRALATLMWHRPESSVGSLVQVSRSKSFARPIFADVISRRSLTLDLPRGRYYWRVKRLDRDGKLGGATSGQLALLRDTSYQPLKDPRPPDNVIRESFGNTTVFYQNTLPNFTFRWERFGGAARYTFKLFREGDLQRPLFETESDEPSLRVPSGRIGEGAYLWYVAARDGAGQLIRTTASRRLRIRYDNATPNLQILQPRNELVVTTDTVETRGVTIRGSKVYVNGAEAVLDESFRFAHSVPLKRGPNDIVFRVVDKRSGPSLYLRRVVRR